MRDDCGWRNNTSKLYPGKTTAHLASLPDRSIQRAPLTWHELPSGVLPCSFLETPLPKSHMAPCWGPGTIVRLPTKRCDFSNWQSLFKCLATSWQTPMLTVGRGNLRGCEGEEELWCRRGRILPLHWFSFSPSLIFRVEGYQQHNWLFG